MDESNNSIGEPVTAVFSWRIGRGNAEIFEHMMHDIHKVARTFPGHMGVTTLKNPTDEQSYQTVLRFDTVAHLDEWLISPIRHEMLKPLLKYGQVDTSSKATGLETWFEIPGQHVTSPPRWKMVAVTFVAIYPVSLLYTLFIAPFFADMTVPIRSIGLSIIAPLLLTYLLMPFLTQRVFKRWLYKPS
ncbi:MAG: antibiotic biosynthesis monooxygenase [Candidatus Saccharibacteria bacterium]|nr:antibiotic biosynthesis monooxygenase [Candidatus Saccharibacteria bacterium]